VTQPNVHQGESGALLEVAVALPVPGTFTYRDPRGGAAVPVGTQVVVPFGARTVTGFVVGPGAPLGDVAAKDIEEVVGGEPAFDAAMIAFGRWTADYYQAPLGEVLRAALPQGEQATAKRAVRLTELGRRALDRQGTLIADAPRDPVLGALADAGGELPLPRLLKLVPRAKGMLPRLADEGAIELGDEVQRRRPAPTVALAFAVPGDAAAALPRRAPARRVLLEKLTSAPDGVPVAGLTPGERTQLRALSMAGLARVLHDLPTDNPSRSRFVRQFHEMAERIVTLQQPDGFWRASLLDPSSYPMRETSGTGFYVYALAWGVNEGLLDRSAFAPAVLRGWDALVSSVHADGKLTRVQPIGETPVHFDEESTDVYGVGAFLLAGSEVYRLLS